MVTIKIVNTISEVLVAKLQITDRVTMVIGNSGTGKTHICEMSDSISRDTVKKNQAYYSVAVDYRNGNSLQVLHVTDLQTYEELLDNSKYDNAILMLDEDVTDGFYKNLNLVAKMMKSCKYTVLYTRDGIVRLSVGVNSVLKVERVRGVYTFRRYFNERQSSTNINLTKVTTIITEDTKSGLDFWKKYFEPEIKVVSSSGNGNFRDILFYELRENKAKVLCALDYDVSGNILCDIIGKLKHKDIVDVIFLKMECFEQIIASSNFILEKLTPNFQNMILNYEKYMNCMYKNRGEYFLLVLRSVFNYIDNSYNEKSCYAKNNYECLVQYVSY